MIRPGEASLLSGAFPSRYRVRPPRSRPDSGHGLRLGGKPVRQWVREMIARKKCPACGKMLSAAAFNQSAGTADGLARTCRACTNARRRQRDRSRKERREPESHPARGAARGDLAAVRELLMAGLKPHWGWVCEVMRDGHLALAELLLESGVERNVFTMAAIGDVRAPRRSYWSSAHGRSDLRQHGTVSSAGDRIACRVRIGLASARTGPHVGSS